ncbi:Secreted chorismate mutase [BD1-7 clade bacterium]|uniref:chorismate mutase n=1 Tax=BD1-7 clade bacterium TaxID=2029982 RepID=A0A5S9QTJ8_9GAMM|nr:Secreted chorismate mutase [BD1-7 clade bacterium]CAA0121748.1 Secreted chorismate mutase [BD1-7 clade bacterium]
MSTSIFAVTCCLVDTLFVSDSARCVCLNASRLRLLLIVTMLLFPHSSWASEWSGVFSLMQQRLGWMQAVAVDKAHAHKPIEDIAREQKVLASSVASAQQAGLDAESTRQFFQTQIAVAKAIQYRWMAEYVVGGVPKSDYSLQKDIRPKLIDLGHSMVAAIAVALSQEEALTAQDRTAFENTLSLPMLHDDDKKALFESLRAIRLQNHR